MPELPTGAEGFTYPDSGFSEALLVSGAIMAVLFLVYIVLVRVITKRVDDHRQRYWMRKSLGYIAFTLAVLLIGLRFLSGAQGVAAYLGLLSAGIAIALRDPIVNLAGWAFILWRKPFQVGDRIETRDIRGDVVDLSLFNFYMLELGNWVAAEQSTGRVVSIPNSVVFSDPVTNYTLEFDYIWSELPIVITFESDWERAKQLLRDLGDAHAHTVSQAVEQQLRQTSRFMIEYGTLTPAAYVAILDHGVQISLRFLVEARQRRTVEHSIWEDVLRAFAAETTIDFAYPTTRLYNNRLEGKSDAGGMQEGDKTDS